MSTVPTRFGRMDEQLAIDLGLARRVTPRSAVRTTLVAIRDAVSAIRTTLVRH